jgi:hypothetical protein
MKTAMQELILKLPNEFIADNPSIILELLEKEKEQIIDFGYKCRDNQKKLPQDIFNQTYNQTNVGNDGFEFDNSSTIPPTKGLCDAKSIYGSELNKELTLDERMHLWFESSRPNRDVCDYVDEMNDIDKAKYLDGCGISRTTKKQITYEIINKIR